ncbi:MAG: DNA-binding protein [Gammaproteobacteria bacterium]|nr:DNA-binding protein [Gammaproteobacteria bacterium]
MPADWSRPVDVDHLADAGEVREIDLPLVDLPRLVPALAGTEGTAHCRIVFSRERGQPMAEVSVQARLGLRCQRCLQPVWLAVDDVSKVWLVTDPERAEELDPGIEPTLAPEGRIALRDLAEEELLLAVPLVPRHDDDTQCVPSEEQAAGRQQEEQVVQRPFAGLGELLKRGR